MPTWKHVIENSEFEPQGELVSVKSSKVVVPLNKTRTAELKISMQNPLAAYISEAVDLEPMYLKSYRDNVMMFHGPLITSQESYSGDNTGLITINAAGPDYIFNQRLAGFTYIGVKFYAEEKITLGEAFIKLLKESEEKENGNSLIDHSRGSEVSFNAGFEATPYVNLAEVIAAMYKQASGFDWVVLPTEMYELEGEPKIGSLVMQNLISQPQPNAVFEWGTNTKGNVSNFNKTTDLTNLVNLGYNIGSAGPEVTESPTLSNTNFEGTGKFRIEYRKGGVLKEAEGTVAELAKIAREVWGVREGVIQASILNIPMRKTILEEGVNIRMRPRQVITMQPKIDLEGENDTVASVPALGVDYNIGDTVPVKVLYDGMLKFYAEARVWATEYTTDENGRETQTLALQEQ